MSQSSASREYCHLLLISNPHGNGRKTMQLLSMWKMYYVDSLENQELEKKSKNNEIVLILVEKCKYLIMLFALFRARTEFSYSLRHCCITHCSLHSRRQATRKFQEKCRSLLNICYSCLEIWNRYFILSLLLTKVRELYCCCGKWRFFVRNTLIVESWRKWIHFIP